jgi:ATP-dependent RNA/DNA helicase IGHMBP2
LAQGVSLEGDDISVLTLIDTAGCGMEEAVEEDGDSKRNEGEAKVTLAHAQRLVSGGVRPEDIGIITPYNAQVVVSKSPELRV